MNARGYTRFVSAALSLLISARAARSDPPGEAAHGPRAPDDRFPSHVFRLAAHQPERVQLAFHYGLSQPLVEHGFNAAVDVRYRRLVLTYSHGQGLDDAIALRAKEKAAGMNLDLSYSTGGGIGVLLMDELWILADFKLHHFDASVGAEQATYETVTVGGEIGWRFFVWRGFNIGVVARYWPNVWSSAAGGIVFHDASGHPFTHNAVWQGASGFLGNVLLGWAFDL